MALSRFWTFILLLSIAYVLAMLFTGRQYTLGPLVNGNQGDALVVYEADSAELVGTDRMNALIPQMVATMVPMIETVQAYVRRRLGEATR